MSFNYNKELLDGGLTYAQYRQGITEMLTSKPADEHAEKMRPHIIKNVRLMDRYDATYEVSTRLKAVLHEAPATTWLIITEGWCGDAAFNTPMMVAIEKLFPEKVTLKYYHRDSNTELIDANLTDGGRSIPKVVVLDTDYNVLGHWGPRPAGLQLLMNIWKEEGLGLKEIIPKAHQWYDNDATNTLQDELIELIKGYSPL